MTMRSLLFKAKQLESLQMPTALWNDILVADTQCFARGIQSVSASLTGPEVAGLIGKVPGTVIPAEYVRSIHNMALQCKPLVPVEKPAAIAQVSLRAGTLVPVAVPTAVPTGVPTGPLVAAPALVVDTPVPVVPVMPDAQTPVQPIVQHQDDENVSTEKKSTDTESVPTLPPSPIRAPSKKRKNNKKQTHDANVEVL